MFRKEVAGAVTGLRVGLTLPSFQSDPGVVLVVARAAEEAGLDGVFAFDHMFRTPAGGGEIRGALELLTVMGMVAAATSRITVGSLVARSSLRPPASLVAGLDTVERVAPGRAVAGIGAGDEESDREDEAFGVGVPDRLARLSDTVDRARGRAYPVWVGGTSPAVRRLAAARADGWNLWGGEPDLFGRRVAGVREEVLAAGRDPAAFTCSWGGLAVLGATEADAEVKLERLGGPRPGLVAGGPARVAEALGAYAAAGAAWVILGPLDSGNPDNAAHLAEAVRRLAR